jgi:hypothetical protein
MSPSGYCTGHTPVTDHVTLEERAHRARRIARVLRHDIDNNPPKDIRVLADAEARYRRFAAEAAAYEVELKKARGY